MVTSAILHDTHSLVDQCVIQCAMGQDIMDYFEKIWGVRDTTLWITGFDIV